MSHETSDLCLYVSTALTSVTLVIELLGQRIKF